MQFLKDNTAGVNLVTGLDRDAVRINDEVYAHSLLLCADRIIAWPVTDVQALTDTDWPPLIATEPEIVILGTGHSLVFPEPHQMRPALENSVGIEVMDTRAACRTYNLLVHEGRRVTAALIFNQVTL
ncbi:MAG: Xcc1710-like domain-containing protein [Gammaproteobacteria bacterium]|nr:Xcc1710-like domain-containing protein [Gammaproteobacteria bacterium]